MSTRASRRNRASRSACRTAAGPYRFESGNVTTGTFASRYRAKSGPLSSSVNTIGSKRVRSSRSMVRAAFNSVPPTRMVETQWATRIGRLPSARASMCVAAIRCSLFSAAPNVGSGALARIATSPASLSEDDDRKCQEHDPHVLDQRLAAQVLQVVSHLYANVVHRRVVGVIDLCQACDPRLRPLPEGVLANVTSKTRENARPFRTRANDVHVIAEHIEQLRNLVKPCFSQQAAQCCHARVVLLSPYHATAAFGIYGHRPELQDAEWATAEVARSSIVHWSRVARTWSSTIVADARLSIDHRAGRREAHRERNNYQERRQHEQRHAGDDDVEHAVQSFISLARQEVHVDGLAVWGREHRRAGAQHRVVVHRPGHRRQHRRLRRELSIHNAGSSAKAA